MINSNKPSTSLFAVKAAILPLPAPTSRPRGGTQNTYLHYYSFSPIVYLGVGDGNVLTERRVTVWKLLTR